MYWVSDVQLTKGQVNTEYSILWTWLPIPSNSCNHTFTERKNTKKTTKIQEFSNELPLQYYKSPLSVLESFINIPKPHLARNNIRTITARQGTYLRYCFRKGEIVPSDRPNPLILQLRIFWKANNSTPVSFVWSFFRIHAPHTWKEFLAKFLTNTFPKPSEWILRIKETSLSSENQIFTNFITKIL